MDLDAGLIEDAHAVIDAETDQGGHVPGRGFSQLDRRVAQQNLDAFLAREAGREQEVVNVPDEEAGAEVDTEGSSSIPLLKVICLVNARTMTGSSLTTH